MVILSLNESIAIVINNDITQLGPKQEARYLSNIGN